MSLVQWKPPQDQRVICYATDEEAKAAGAWVLEKFNETLKVLDDRDSNGIPYYNTHYISPINI